MKTAITLYLMTFLVLVSASGCMSIEAGKNKVPPREVVLKSGESISFRNSNGTGEYVYVDEQTRMLKLDGAPHRIPMITREERFLGMLGIYNPAAGRQGGPVRIVAVEAEKHFGTREEALKHLVEGSAVMDWVMNCDGYIVGYSETPHRNQINVSLFRYFVGSKPAKALKGCDPNSVRLIERDGSR